MAFDLLTKVARLIVGRRYTSTDLTDSQEAFTSTIQISSNEIWSQANLIPSASLPFSSSVSPGTTQTNGVLKYWYRYPMTVANNTALANSVWFFTSPTGSISGIGSQLIDNGQQTNFINPKYSVVSLTNQSADYGNNGNPPGYNISLFTSADGVAFTAWTSSNYTFDYKTGVLEFSGSIVPANRIYATVYQYVGQMVSDALLTASNTTVTSSYFSGSTITASNLNVTQTSSLNIITANTASFIYFSLNNSSSAPNSSSDVGLPGEMRIDDNYVYIYTKNVWTRIPKSRWT